MAKSKKFLDKRQLSIFDLLSQVSSQKIGVMDIDRAFREKVSEILRQCPLSRYQVAARMSELVGQDITKSMLDSWTKEMER